MKKSSDLRVLTITLEEGLRRETKNLLQNKLIQLDFVRKSELDKLSKKEKRKYGAVCVVTRIVDEIKVILWSNSQEVKPQTK